MLTLWVTDLLPENKGGQSVEFRLNFGLRIVIVVSILDFCVL
jgi:hypothetical protein